jgi:hypothetical protein
MCHEPNLKRDNMYPSVRLIQGNGISAGCLLIMVSYGGTLIKPSYADHINFTVICIMLVVNKKMYRPFFFILFSY